MNIDPAQRVNIKANADALVGEQKALYANSAKGELIPIPVMIEARQYLSGLSQYRPNNNLFLFLHVLVLCGSRYVNKFLKETDPANKDMAGPTTCAMIIAMDLCLKLDNEIREKKEWDSTSKSGSADSFRWKVAFADYVVRTIIAQSRFERFNDKDNAYEDDLVKIPRVNEKRRSLARAARKAVSHLSISRHGTSSVDRNDLSDSSDPKHNFNGRKDGKMLKDDKIELAKSLREKRKPLESCVFGKFALYDDKAEDLEKACLDLAARLPSLSSVDAADLKGFKEAKSRAESAKWLELVWLKDRGYWEEMEDKRGSDSDKYSL